MAKVTKQEENQAKVISNGVELIQTAMQMAFRMNLMAGGGSAGMVTILVLVAEIIITALADAIGGSKEEAMEEYFNMIRTNIHEKDKGKN